MNKNTNQPKQRRRKKKEEPQDPQAAREEAELRMKIQQSLQNQYVDRATVEQDQTMANNPTMMLGQMDMSGALGEQYRGMNIMGMQQMMMQQQMMAMMMMQQQQQHFQDHGQFNQQQHQFNRQISNYKSTQDEMTQNNQMRSDIGMGWGSTINSVDIMSELRKKQEELLHMGAAQKDMEEMRRGMSLGDENNHYSRGSSGGQKYPYDSNQSPYVGQESLGHRDQNQTSQPQKNYPMDLNEDPQLCKMQALDQLGQQILDQIALPMKMQQNSSPGQFQDQNKQATMQHQNVQNNQGNVTQTIPPKRSNGMLISLLEQLYSEHESESALESLLSMPTADGGFVRDSLTVDDAKELQAWLDIKSSKCRESIGFYSVNNDMSASFSSVLGTSMISLDEEQGVTDVLQDDGNAASSKSHASPGNINRDRSHDLAPIAEHDLDGTGRTVRKNHISSTLNNFKQGCTAEQNTRSNYQKPPKAPPLGETNLNASLTVDDLKDQEFSQSKSSSNDTQKSGMSLSLGDFGYDILDSQCGEDVMGQNPTVPPNTTPNPSENSEMSMDSTTYITALSDILEDDITSRISSAPSMEKAESPGLLEGSRHSSEQGIRKSNASRPSIISEITQWSNSNPYGDDSEQNEERHTTQQNSGQEDDKDVSELDETDFSLSIMSSLGMSEGGDQLMMSLQKLEVSQQGSHDCHE